MFEEEKKPLKIIKTKSIDVFILQYFRLTVSKLQRVFFYFGLWVKDFSCFISSYCVVVVEVIK